MNEPMKQKTSINNFLSVGQPALPKFTHGSLFSGIGGFDLASQWTGWDNIFQVEIDKYCQRLLKQNFPNVERYTDIQEFDGTKYRGTIDVVSGGFPCQPFSVAGNQAGEDDNRYLWPEMLRVISEIKPRFIVGENVFGIVSISLDQVLSDLEALGYTTETFIVPACAVNAPHRRDRVWIIGYTEHTGLNGSKNGEGSNQGSNGDQERQNEICKPTRPALSRDAIENTNGIRCNGKERKGKSKIGGQWKSGSGNDERVSGEKTFTDTKEQGLEREQPKRNTSTNGRGSKYDFNSTWTQVASEFCRVDDGIPNRVDRIKGLGNAIVPQVAFEIFTAIDFVLKGGKKNY